MRSTNTEDGAEGAVAAMIDMARGLLSVEKVDHIGVCFGGPVVRNRIVRSLHIPGWQDFPIHERLRAHFGDIPIRVANDANAVALGEFKYGAGRGATAMLFLTVSTGVGGAVILNGSLWEGSHGFAGEIGHTRVVAEGGDLCTCGGHGCLETVSSGPSMVKRAWALLSNQPDMPSMLRSMSDFTARDLDQLAAGADSVAVQIVREGARYLGIAVANAINLLDLDCVVIGGGVSRSGDLWWDTLHAAVDEVRFPWLPPIDLKPSELGTNEGIWGAVALLEDEH